MILDILNRFFLHFRKNSRPKKLNRPKNSRIFQAKTQPNGSDNSHMDFKTQVNFSIFAVDKAKVLILHEAHQKDAIFSAF